MKIKNVHGLYFSPTGNGRKITEFLCFTLASHLAGEGESLPIKYRSLNSEESRSKAYAFESDDIVVIAMPTYAGRVPNILRYFLENSFEGNGAYCIPVVTYGNRAYQYSLLELTMLMKKNGFRNIAGAAFIGQHPFSAKLGRGRPDMEDMKIASRFGIAIAEALTEGTLTGETLTAEAPEEFMPEGNPAEIAYYTPLGIDGAPAKFLNACPVQDDMRCTDCGRCYLICPVASKNFCIKCMACVEYCPAVALKFEDEAFLSHVAYLEANYSDEVVKRKEPELFIGSCKFF